MTLLTVKQQAAWDAENIHMDVDVFTETGAYNGQPVEVNMNLGEFIAEQPNSQLDDGQGIIEMKRADFLAYSHKPDNPVYDKFVYDGRQYSVLRIWKEDPNSVWLMLSSDSRPRLSRY